ncbi:hypothetical protein [Devosia rhizoryzae]|uniref:Uncharacterized protein n=1 Tax=Devosia rhizoryzae TaxID=2774137 RepID=A0ABX7C7I9_9HYPH|nr:hypothetical protein [Devosia rhizoryzae]QQR40222.1 hypothetical protein JI748_04210 [Devosia rhizoryzae]
MPTDSATLIGLGVAAIVILWLVFSVLKKVIGFAVLAAFVAAAYFLWTNPALLQRVLMMLPG